RSPRRKGFADGQAPAQMPQAAQRSSSTTAIRPRPPGCGAIAIAAYGQSSKQRSQPLQFAGSTFAAWGRGLRDNQGAAASATVRPVTTSQTMPGEPASTAGSGAR
ncbi:MAG TPA: hypothetical protein PK177_22615, partial [Burkholderiaceae bacterium]|nr:hypothetical protein [Burkholderiaceae bacterium]